MKRKILISLILLSPALLMNAQQIYTGEKISAVYIQSANNNYNENLRLFPSTSNGYSSIALGAAEGNSGTGIGQWTIFRSPATENYLFCIRYNSSDYLRITNSGNIGIGATPIGKLHIDAGTNSGNDGKVLIRSSSADHGQFQILNPTGAEASMCFIGLGTAFGASAQSNGGNSHIWSLGSNIWGNGGNIFGIGNKDYASQTGNGQILFIKSNGTVGIGANPLGKLYIDAGANTGIEGKVLIRSSSNVHGQIQILNPAGGESSIAFIGSGTTFGTSPQSSAGNSNIWVIGNNVWGNGGNVFGIGNVDFANNHNNNGQIIGINSNGNVDINGTIHAREVKVDLSFPADYVFKPDYKLMTLLEVEQFIKANCHLPEIPSAVEIKENGLNIGDMQNKLLQKIEEMTLYIIEQNKKIEQQDQEMQIMKEKMSKLEAAPK